MCGEAFIDSTRGHMLKSYSLSMARLDRFYCFKHHFSSFTRCFISPFGFADNSPVTASVFIKCVKPNSVCWHLNILLEGEVFFGKNTKVQNLILNRLERRAARYWKKKKKLTLLFFVTLRYVLQYEINTGILIR